MLVASGQAPSTFLDVVVFPLSRQKFSNLYEAKRALAHFLWILVHICLVTGRDVLSLCSSISVGAEEPTTDWSFTLLYCAVSIKYRYFFRYSFELYPVNSLNFL